MRKKHSCNFNYADDTESSCKDKDEQSVVKKLEEFMASNGLVANPTKTVFMMLNNNKKENKRSRKITVGNHKIEESKSTKLLGMMIDNDHKWKRHLLSALNQRLVVMVKRMSQKRDYKGL
jgi:hypothetical protein